MIALPITPLSLPTSQTMKIPTLHSAKVLRSLGLAVGLLASTSLVPASLLTADGFDYASGSDLDTLNGGSGWNGAWNVDGGGGNQSISSPSPLAYGSLVTTGNYVTGSGYKKGGRKLDNSPGGVWDNAGFISDVWTVGRIDQGTVWASFLLSRNKDISAWEGFSVFVHQDFTGNAGVPANSPFHISINTVDQSWQVQNMGGNQTTLGTTAIGDSAFFVLKMELNPTGSNNLYLWLNPSTATLGGADLAVGTANWSTTGLSTDNARFRSFAVEIGGTNTGSYDEIRFGTSYASVTPIPEPSAVVLVLVATAGMALSRRRRRA